MRPIDAEALPVVTECCVDEAGFFAKFNVVHEEDINKAPTLSYKDLVPHGKWITEYDEHWEKYYHTCSLCGNDYTSITKYLENYCSNCGAKMEGENK